MPTIDIRCRSCRALLAKRDKQRLRVRRGEFAVVVGGAFSATLHCRCGGLERLTQADPALSVA